jgi:hypothetical protein
VKVLQSTSRPKARYFSACYSAPFTSWKKASDGCRAHVKAIGNDTDSMEIVSMECTHTCGRTDSVEGQEGTSNKRKTNYQMKDICTVSDILSVYEPAKGGGNTKQLMKMTKVATGIDIKNGQANLAVKSK